MTPPEIILLCIVIGVGCTAALRNVTSLALVASYAFGMAMYQASGSMPIQAQIIADLGVLATIYAKPDWCDCLPYRRFRLLFCVLWQERSPWDRAVVCLTMGMWAAYAMPISDFTSYWSLWWLAVLQFLAAGGESLFYWRAAMRLHRQGVSPPGLMFAQARVRGYG